MDAATQTVQSITEEAVGAGLNLAGLNLARLNLWVATISLLSIIAFFLSGILIVLLLILQVIAR